MSDFEDMDLSGSEDLSNLDEDWAIAAKTELKVEEERKRAEAEVLRLAEEHEKIIAEQKRIEEANKLQENMIIEEEAETEEMRVERLRRQRDYENVKAAELMLKANESSSYDSDDEEYSDEDEEKYKEIKQQIAAQKNKKVVALRDYSHEIKFLDLEEKEKKKYEEEKKKKNECKCNCNCGKCKMVDRIFNTNFTKLHETAVDIDKAKTQIISSSKDSEYEDLGYAMANVALRQLYKDRTEYHVQALLLAFIDKLFTSTEFNSAQAHMLANQAAMIKVEIIREAKNAMGLQTNGQARQSRVITKLNQNKPKPAKKQEQQKPKPVTKIYNDEMDFL